MATRKYVSNIEASYFIEHQLHCLPEPPTSGSYKVGDVVISSNQEKDIFGWVCIKSGEPGTWQVILDISLMKASIKALQDKEIVQDELIEILRQRIEKMYDELKQKNTAQDVEISNMNKQVQINVTNINKLLEDVEVLDGNNDSLGNELRESISELAKKVNININDTKL